MTKQSGFSLIEIMIALSIGVFLLGGIVQIFSASQQTYRMQRNLARLQENGRFALDFLARDIRMAGYWGCLNGMSTDIAGADNNAVAGDSIDDGTDTIVLRAVFDLFILTPPLSCGSTANAVDNCCISDPSLTSNVCPILPISKKVNCYTDPRSMITYKINNGVLQQDTNNSFNPLIEGIQDMQIFYGIDSDGDGAANYYVSAFANMSPVVSVRISLLVATLEDHLTTQPMTYTYYINNVLQNITPTDHRIRRVFNTTIALRNHLP